MRELLSSGGLNQKSGRMNALAETLFEVTKQLRDLGRQPESNGIAVCIDGLGLLSLNMKAYLKHVEIRGGDFLVDGARNARDQLKRPVCELCSHLCEFGIRDCHCR
jgi:hypothetical protein